MHRRPSSTIDPASTSAEPFRALRLALTVARERHDSVLVVTSAGRAEGRTTVTANLALVATLAGMRTLVVDADLRTPSLHTSFGIKRSPGLTELLAHGAALQYYPHRAALGGSTVDVIPAGDPTPGAVDLVASPRTRQLLEQAREHYDLVLLDAPPLSRALDAAGLATLPGVSALLVVRAGIRRKNLTTACRKLELLRANLAGIVVNAEGHIRDYTA